MVNLIYNACLFLIVALVILALFCYFFQTGESTKVKAASPSTTYVIKRECGCGKTPFLLTKIETCSTPIFLRRHGIMFTFYTTLHFFVPFSQLE